MITLKNAIYLKEHDIERLKNQLDFNFKRFLSAKFSLLDKSLLKFKSLDPKQNFKKGYTVVEKDKDWIKSSLQLKKGDKVKLYFLDGYKEVEVI